MSYVTILPSLPAEDFANLKELAEKIAPVAAEIQIDIVDGQFVSTLSWPFTEMLEEGNGFVETIAKVVSLPDTLAREFDCMVSEPYQYLDALLALNPARIIIHHKSTIDYNSCIGHARAHNYKIGLAVLPTVELEDIAELLTRFDYVQVMGIERVGSQGQPFAPQALALIASIHAAFPDFEIAVDGAVNKETIPALVAAGATRLAPGSAIARATDPTAAYLELVALSSHSL